MTLVQRYLRAVTGIQAYTFTDQASLERLLQKGYKDKPRGQLPDGSWPLQKSISVYRVQAEHTQSGFIIPAPILAALNAKHTGTAGMAEPNTHFLDITDFLGTRPCPQEDSFSPFPELRRAHHSLKFSDEADLRAWMQSLCQTGPLFHAVDRDEMVQFMMTAVTSQTLSPEWQQVKALLLPQFSGASLRRKRANFAFWLEAGFLSLDSESQVARDEGIVL